jgi:hypothetical protein
MLMEAINIKAFPADLSQVEALKAFMKALKIKFELSKAENLYSPEFIAKIKQGEEDLENGKGIKMSLEDLDKLWK